VPVVSFHLYADVGSVDEEIGETAHMFEPMASRDSQHRNPRLFRERIPPARD
jgi:predicted Zn-dependent peptidase